jgi:hypothetical protein
MRKWKRVFMDGCECKIPISVATEFITPFEHERNKSICLRITLTNNDTSVKYLNHYNAFS